MQILPANNCAVCNILTSLYMYMYSCTCMYMYVSKIFLIKFFASLVELPSMKNNGSIFFQWHDGRRCTKACFSESECVAHDRLALHAFYSLSFKSAQGSSISIRVSSMNSQNAWLPPPPPSFLIFWIHLVCIHVC